MPQTIALAAALLLFALIAGALPARDLDLNVYRQAAERTFGARVDPYPRGDGEVLPFTYPPTALFLIYPFSRLDLHDSARLVWGLNLVLVPTLMWLLVGDLARTSPPNRAPDPRERMIGQRLRVWGPLYMASFGGVYLTLHFHQINLLILLCLWLYWRRARLGQAGYAAGAALALGAVAKPHYGLLLLAALQWPGARPSAQGVATRAADHPLRRALRPVFGAALGGSLLLALSLLIAPPGSWDSWLKLVPGHTSYIELPPGHSSIAAPWNRSIPGQVARLLLPNKFSQPVFSSPSATALLSTLLVFAAAVATLWLLRDVMRARWRLRLPTDPRIVDLELSLLSVLVFLAAPASWTHHLVMLLPAALVLLRDVVLDPRAPSGSRFTAALVLVALALTLDDLIPREVRVSCQAIMGLMTVAVLSLWLLLMERLYRLRASG
ncbi:MAG: glycosyltransferase family 87 protein [Thiohalocapsa sp.]